MKYRIFSFDLTGCHTNVKKFRLHYFLPEDGRRKFWFMLSQSLLTVIKVQTALSKIWTLVSEIICCVDNRYATSRYFKQQPEVCEPN